MKLTNKIKMKIAKLVFDPVQLLSYLKSLQVETKPKTGTNGYYLNKFVYWLEHKGNYLLMFLKLVIKNYPFNLFNFTGGKLSRCSGLFSILLFLEGLEISGYIFRSIAKYFINERFSNY